MKYLFSATLILMLAGSTWGQSQLKFRLHNKHHITGELVEVNDNQYVIRESSGTLIYVPKEIVRMVKSYRPYLSYPGYDKNKNDFFFGVQAGYNMNIGQSPQNLSGWMLQGQAGCDWNHRYAMSVKAGISSMNSGKKEIYLPVTLSVKKYLTQGRHLLYVGLESGYSWGLVPVFEEFEQSGGGPLIIPALGIRRIGKYGRDHELQIGFHLQQYYSRHEQRREPFSEIELIYRRWSISYGVIF